MSKFLHRPPTFSPGPLVGDRCNRPFEPTVPKGSRITPLLQLKLYVRLIFVTSVVILRRLIGITVSARKFQLHGLLNAYMSYTGSKKYMKY
jgi:hypothetical protein